MGRGDLDQKTGQSDDIAQWMTHTRALSILSAAVPLNVWFKFRFERGWNNPTPLQANVYIDDVLVADWTITTLPVGRFHILGAHPFNSQWGDFDMRNLKFYHGTLATPQLVLDMPLIENALDLSPEANHGTTFNMDLPSG